MKLNLGFDPAPLHARLIQIDRILEAGDKRQARMLLASLQRELPELIGRMVTVTPGP